MTGCTHNGVLVENDCNNWKIYGNTLIITHTAADSLNFNQDVHFASVWGNSFHSTATPNCQGVSIQASGGTNSSNIEIFGNHFTSSPGNTIKYQIEESINITTTNNVFDDTVVFDLSPGNANLVFRNNIGYIGTGDIRTNAGNLEMWNSTAWVIIGP